MRENAKYISACNVIACHSSRSVLGAGLPSEKTTVLSPGDTCVNVRHDNINSCPCRVVYIHDHVFISSSVNYVGSTKKNISRPAPHYDFGAVGDPYCLHIG